MSRPSTFPYPSTSTLSSNPSTSTLSTTSSTLQNRIALKRAELAQLQQLRDLSAQLASQMTVLQNKLGSLRDGAEAVACVLANWDGVLGVIGLVGRHANGLGQEKVDGGAGGQEGREEGAELPETLVRIPVGDVNGNVNGKEDGDGV